MKRLAKLRSLLIRFILFSFCLFPMQVHAEQSDGWLHEFRLGILDHDTDNLWSGFSREGGVDFNGELIFTPQWELWGGVVRPNLGVTINNQGDTSKIYGGGLWEYAWSNGIFFDFGLGLAYHDGEKVSPDDPDIKELGRQVLLRVAAEAGYSISDNHRISIMFDHISNGYTEDPNEGLDTLGIRYGFRF